MKEILSDVFIGPEQPEDIEGIRRVNLAAFDGTGEADVVDQLRQTCPVFVSLAAKLNDLVLGHVLFTPAEIRQDNGWVTKGMGLAPLAVLPEYQNKGIGAALCHSGLRQLESLSYPFVIVLGHPNYYPRFGFTRASAFGINCAYPDVPDEAFMIHIFDDAFMEGVKGVAHYRPEFDAIT